MGKNSIKRRGHWQSRPDGTRVFVADSFAASMVIDEEIIPVENVKITFNGVEFPVHQETGDEVARLAAEVEKLERR